MLHKGNKKGACVPKIKRLWKGRPPQNKGRKLFHSMLNEVYFKISARKRTILLINLFVNLYGCPKNILNQKFFPENIKKTQVNVVALKSS